MAKKKKVHDYSAPQLAQHIRIACDIHAALTGMLFLIQEETHIPGYHTNINSDDDTAGVLERIQFMHDEGENDLEAFKSFDKES